MQMGTGSSYWLLSVILATACGSTDNNDPTGGAGSAGASSAGSGGLASTAGSSATGGQPAGSGGKPAGGSNNGGATAGGGGAAPHAGSAGASGHGGQSGMGGSNAQAGASSGGGPASTAGLPFVGSCVDATHCTDEWDTSFGADTLQQICTAQQGAWSTGHCDPAPWKKKCTQAVFSGVYVQYLPADGICAAGFEETL